jgi:dihydroorotase
VGFSDDGRCVVNSMVMRNALKYAGMLGKPVISHTQDNYLFGDGVMHEGEISTRLGLPGIPALAEEVMTARELLLAEHDGTAVHLAHVSTARAVAMIRRAKAAGVRVTAEATPHHFTLDHRELTGFSSNLKMSPPLRTPEDVAAVREGLADGTLDLIVTDHAPHTWEEKEREFSFAPFGIIGLETALALGWRSLVEPGVLTVSRWVERVSVAPRRLFGLPEVRLEAGGRAELTIFHPRMPWTYRTAEGFSRSANTPFDGWEFAARPLGVVVKGALVRPEGVWELANLG